MQQQADDPPYLSAGTEVSAKYKGAFCEAKISKVVRNIKCRVAYKSGLGISSGIVSDDQIKNGQFRVGATVEIKLPDRRDLVEATITKIQDSSLYTVVFDDGDITTLRRSALCLRSGRHFNESETLDQLPLTHPEHFGNPVIGGRGRGRRSQQMQDDSCDEDEEEDIMKASVIEKEENIGKVICVELTETKKKGPKENWFPALVVDPKAQDNARIRVKDEYLVRSFKDGRYYTVPKKEANEFTRDIVNKQDTRPAVLAALEYLNNDKLPPHWERDALFGSSYSMPDYDDDYVSESSDEEPPEEQDHFLAKLIKFMDDRGTPLNKGPSITNKEVDLYRLFRQVKKLGGFNRVSKKQWKHIAGKLGYTPTSPSIINLVKQAYKKFLHAFEDFDRKLGCTVVSDPRSNRSKGRSLVRANSVASPKPDKDEELKSSSSIAAEESESTSESSNEPLKPITKRKLSTNSNKVVEEKGNSSSSVNELHTSNCVNEKPKSNKNVSKERIISPDNSAASGNVPSTSNSNTNKTKAATKKAPIQSEDLKPKVGKKIKKESEIPKNDDTNDSCKSNPNARIDEFIIDVGDKLSVLYHEPKVRYTAKVLEISNQQGSPLYLVHYTGWNTRYDEWVPKDRIAENITKGKENPLKISSKSDLKSTLNEKGLAPTATGSKITSKRGRGGSRSESLPPRSTTPSSVASNSSRTKSPATSTQRRITRGPPTTRLRRTSNNTDISSLQTDTDTDSDEPVLKRTTNRSSISNKSSGIASNISPSNMSVITENTSKLKDFESKMNKDATDNNDENESEKIKDKKTYGFNTKVNDLKKEAKLSNELSSETDSFGDDDSQFSDRTTTLENISNKMQMKEFEKTGTDSDAILNRSCEKLLMEEPINQLEKIIKDTLEKPQKAVENYITNTIDQDFRASSICPTVKTNIPDNIISAKSNLSNEKSVIVSKPSANNKTLGRTDKKLWVTESQSTIKSVFSGSKLSNVRLSTTSAKDLKSEPSDVYEFKEPEPFEFEVVQSGKKSQTISIEAEKKVKGKKSLASASAADSKPLVKRTKRSPVKSIEKDKDIDKPLKQLKMELTAENEKKMNFANASGTTTLFVTHDHNLDVLRQSSNLVASGQNSDNLLMNELASLKSTVESKIIPHNPPTKVPLHPPATCTETTTSTTDTSKIFDMKSPSDEEGKEVIRKQFEAIKQILHPDIEFDDVLDKPKSDKPSIADKVLKALTQQQQMQSTPSTPEKELMDSPSHSKTGDRETVGDLNLCKITTVVPPKIDLIENTSIVSDRKVDILELLAPKNNVLNETIQKLESVIQKTSIEDRVNDRYPQEDSSDSTDLEGRLVIEDESQGSEIMHENATNKPLILNMQDNDDNNEENIPSKLEKVVDQNFKPIHCISNTLKSEKKETIVLTKNLKKIEQSAESAHNESISMLLCSETIPCSPTSVTLHESSDLKKERVTDQSSFASPNPMISDSKTLPIDLEVTDLIPQHRIGIAENSCHNQVSLLREKCETDTPISSPRDSISQDDSSEDLKKQEQDADGSAKKRRRPRKLDIENESSKRRRGAPIQQNQKKSTFGTDSEDNSDVTGGLRLNRPQRPCQYNFLVQLDPAMNSNQRIMLLKKKIQELRKTYNMIKTELASVDRRRKKLRRRERENKKNQQKVQSTSI